MTERWSTTLIRAVVGLLIVSAVIVVILLCLGFRFEQIGEMFSHAVAPRPEAPEEAPRKPFGFANHMVLGAYLVLVLAIGYAASRRIKGTRSFFVADGRLNYVLVGISLLGTYLSALTMTALPGAAFGKLNWLYAVQLPFLVITAVVITRFVLPRYREAGVISVYEYLEQRIHLSARMLASISFLIFSVARLGLLLYMPALAFHTVSGVSLPFCIFAMGVIVTIYTVMGGMEAVVWTDAVQVVIFVVCALVTLGYVFYDLGVERFLEIGIANNKFQYIDPSLNFSQIVTLWLILETIFQTIRIYGTQQDMTQRYMATQSTAKANRSVWISTLGYIPLGFIFYFLGTALFAFYKAHPAPLPAKPDQIYPFFIVNRLPAGVAGLVIAAIFAAAMSSIDSLMNSSSTVCIEDFFKRFSKRPSSDALYLRKARYLTIIWGGLTIGMALMCIGVEYAQILWGKIMGIATNGMLGLMALAFLPFRIDKWAAVAGFAASYVCLLVMMASGVNFLLWCVIGNLTCFFVALLVNPLLAGEAPEPAESS